MGGEQRGGAQGNLVDREHYLHRDSGEQGAVVTIIVPTYKRPDLLEQCLKAISRQTFSNYRVLVCDNSPEAEGRPIVASLADDRFRHVPREKNIGMLANVLHGFKEADTEYVMEVDDDDILYPRCLELLLAPFQGRPDLTIVFGDLDVIDDRHEVLSARRRVRYLPSLGFLDAGIHQPFTDLAAYGYVFLMASVLRRSHFDWDEVPAKAATAYDRYLTLAASRGDAAGYFVRAKVMAYRVHERSDGLRFTTQCLTGALEVLRHEAPLATPSSRKSIELEIIRTRLRLLRAFRTAGDHVSARHQARELLNPMSARALAYMTFRQYLPQRVRLLGRVAGERLARWSRTPFVRGR